MRILLADDHDLVREGLRPILRRLGTGVEVVECGTLEDALRLASGAGAVNLAILDLKMPGMNGVAGVEVFRRQHPHIPVVVLSGYYRRDEALRVLELGAAGFAPKTLGGSALLKALKLVLAGEKYVPAEILPGIGGGEAENPLASLTRRERETLDQLMEGLPNKAIGRALGVQEVTVKLHLRKVYQKLGVANRAAAVRAALRLGWVE